MKYYWLQTVLDGSSQWIIGLNIAICVLQCINYQIREAGHFPYPSVLEGFFTRGELNLMFTVQGITILTKKCPFLALGNTILLTLIFLIEILFLHHAAKKVYGKAGTWLTNLVMLCIIVCFAHFVMGQPNVV